MASLHSQRRFRHNPRRLRLGLVLLALVAMACAFWPRAVAAAKIVAVRIGTARTIEERVGEFGEVVRARLAPNFAAAGVSWPAQRLRLVAFKAERRLEVWAFDSARGWRLLRTYPMTAASGVLGPKLREGDEQVPEGLYPIESLNPNSLFHLALRVGYPNDFDRARALEDGRSKLGGDIMIHGGDRSVGCLALGDAAAEDLFVMTALAGVSNTDAILAPCDLRANCDPLPPDTAPPWTLSLWAEIRRSLDELGR